jgi:hypothetical protein
MLTPTQGGQHAQHSIRDAFGGRAQPTVDDGPPRQDQRPHAQAGAGAPQGRRRRDRQRRRRGLRREPEHRGERVPPLRRGRSGRGAARQAPRAAPPGADWRAAGAQQARLVAIACSPVPDGHDHWTLRLLAGKAVELGFVARISPATIRALWRRTRSSRGGTSTGASRR